MNKKILGIAIGSVIFVIMLALLLRSKDVNIVSGVKTAFQSKISVTSPAKYLPESTGMYYSISGISSYWAELQKTHFWKNFSALKLWEDIQVKENIEKLKTEFKNETGVELSETLVMNLIGNQLALGIILKEDATPSIIVQSYTGKAAQIVETMVQDLIAKSKASPRKISHQDEEIFVFDATDESEVSYGYVMVNNVLTIVLQGGEAELKSVVDLIKGSASNNLDTSKVYQEAKSFFGEVAHEMEYFVDFSKISKMIPQYISAFAALDNAVLQGIDLNNALKELDKILYLGGTGALQGNMFVTQSVFAPNTEKLSEEDKLAWKDRDQSFKTLDFVPLNSILVNLTGGLNAAGYIKTLRENAALALSGTDDLPSDVNPVSDFMDSFAELEQITGVSLESLASKIGNEFAFILQDIDTKDIFPLIKTGVVVVSPDAKGLQADLKKLIDEALSSNSLPVQSQEENVSGAHTIVFATPFGEAYSPVLASKDNMVYVAMNKATLMDFISADAGIQNNPQFKLLTSKTQGTQLNFVDLKLLNTKIRGFIERALQSGQLNLIPGAEEIQKNIANYVVPLMQTLEALSNMHWIVYQNDGRVEQSMKILFSDTK